LDPSSSRPLRGSNAWKPSTPIGGPGASAGSRRFRSLAFEPRRIDWWASVVQFVGTLAFNVTTFRAMQTSFGNASYDRLVWAPDAVGSVCFLVSGYLAYVEVCGRFVCLRLRDLDWQIAAVNFLGCIAFGISTVGSYVVPSTGGIVDLSAANFTTALGPGRARRAHHRPSAERDSRRFHTRRLGCRALGRRRDARRPARRHLELAPDSSR
jgi:hypothetical protein